MKRMRDELEKQNKNILISTLLSVGEAMITIDVKGAITFVNDPALEVLKLSFEKVIGASITDIVTIHVVGDDAPLDILSPQMIERSGLPKGSYLIDASGQHVFLSAKFSELLAEDGKCLGYVIVFRDITNLLKAENRVEREKNSLEGMFELMTSGLAIVSSKMIIKKINKTFGRIFHMKPHEAVGMLFGEGIGCVWHLENGCGEGFNCKFCRFRQMIRRMIDSQSPMRDEIFQLYFNKEGMEYSAWISASVMTISYEDEEAYLITIEDVTESISYQKKLEEAKNNSLMLLDNLPVMIYRLDIHQKCQFVNQTFKRYLGFDHHALDGILNQRMKPEAYVNLIEKIDDAYSHHKGFEIETELLSKRGQYRSVIGVGQPIFNDQNKFIGILGVFIDIHEARVAKQLYMRSQSKYKLLFENLDSSISYHKIIYDKEHKIIDSELIEMNPASHLMFDRLDQNWFKQRMSDIRFMDDALKRSFFSKCEHVLETGEAIHIPHLFFPPLDKWLEVALYSPEPGYVALIVTDVDFKTRAEIALKEAKEKSEEANRAKSDFLANMSHEIRTPLNGIVGMIDLTMLSPLNDEQKEHLIIAKSCVHTLIDIINDVLDFSKIEAGKLSITPDTFDIEEMLRNVIKTHMAHAHNKAIELKSDFVQIKNKYYVGDVKRIKQVLHNLISNAIKFTHQGFVNVRIENLSSDYDSETIRFSVKDTGIGVGDDKKNELFKSFTQIDGSYTRQYGGTGLGLVISKQLVELMGGHIAFESKRGVGSWFYFDLVLKVANAPVQTTYFVQSTPHFTGKKVLLVEDDKVNQTVMSKMLEKMDLEVYYANNGQEALDAAYFQTYDMILMDIQMPIMDGMKATEVIRSTPNLNQKTPIIALTAYALKGDEALFMSSGMDDYLSKPVSREQLIQMLHKFLDNVLHLAKDSHEPLIVEHVKAFHGAQKPTIDEDTGRHINRMLKNIKELILSENIILLEVTAHQLKLQFEEINAAELKQLAFKMELEIRKEQYTKALDIVGRICEIMLLLCPACTKEETHDEDFNR